MGNALRGASFGHGMNSSLITAFTYCVRESTRLAPARNADYDKKNRVRRRRSHRCPSLALVSFGLLVLARCSPRFGRIAYTGKAPRLESSEGLSRIRSP